MAHTESRSLPALRPRQGRAPAAAGERDIASRAQRGYRLAPENPFPAGLQDVLAIVRNVAEESGFLAVGGESAGAHLALLALLALRDNGERLADAAVLNYGAYDLAGTPSASDRLVEPASLLLPDVQRAELRQSGYSPLYADLSGGPHAGGDQTGPRGRAPLPGRSGVVRDCPCGEVGVRRRDIYRSSSRVSCAGE